MSVCSATAAASHRPGPRRESRGSSTRASTSEAQFFIDKGGLKPIDQRLVYVDCENNAVFFSIDLK